MDNKKFRECGECNLCCKGHLQAEIFDYKMGNGKPCIYLKQEKCSVYKDRPEVCKKYQCAWSQYLFPEWMRPDKTGALISVENNPETQQQYLKLIETKPTINYDVYFQINKFCNDNNTHYVRISFESNYGT